MSIVDWCAHAIFAGVCSCDVFDSASEVSDGNYQFTSCRQFANANLIGEFDKFTRTHFEINQISHNKDQNYVSVQNDFYIKSRLRVNAIRITRE